MKTTNFFLLNLMLFAVSVSVSAQHFVDGENASVNPNGKLNDNGRTLTWALQGDNVPRPWVSNFSRSGSKSIGMKTGASTTGSTSQRSEYCLNICYPDLVDINDGETWYTGFSILLSNNEWADPSSWFVLQQTQQQRESGQQGNYPFAALHIEKGNKLVLSGKSGKNGNTQRNPSPVFKERDVISVKKGIWYDIVVGWKFRPNNTDGWIACWIKTADQTNYKKYSMDNIKLGYYGAPKKIQQNKVGLYRGRVNGTNTAYFDEVRFGKRFNDAKHPSANGTPPPVGDYVSMRKRNAIGFAIDANNARKGKKIHMWSYNSNNNNQKFKEINRGGGYYSYQAKGTNLCIDGGNGGSLGQQIVMWPCQGGNQNQHWKKEDKGSGNYRLVKRNAPGFAIDAGNGGNEGNQIVLWKVNNSHNQQFRFGNNRSSKFKQTQNSSNLIVYPNPTDDIFIIESDADIQANAIINIYSTIGTIIKTVQIKNKVVNIGDLQSGLYFIQLVNGSEIQSSTLIKN